MEKDGLTKGADESLKKDGNNVSPNNAAPKGNVASSQTTRPKTKAEGAIVSAKEGHGLPEGVCVGDIVVTLGAQQERVVRKEDQKNGDGLNSKKLELHTDADKVNESRVLLRNYRSMSNDVKWAQHSLVATIINGEAIP
ncbi:hypothetical protein A2U01_0056197, partial [Trifolium medium]|nr:hypothetical protein [Trifolium medium]